MTTNEALRPGEIKTNNLRKAYHQPKLIVRGHVSRLTLGVGSIAFDEGAQSPLL